MTNKKKSPIFDDDNPEWTKADFAKAQPPSELPAEVLAAFPKTRAGRPRKTDGEKKVAVSLRLSPMVVEHFKSQGPGWQTRLDSALVEVVRKKRQAPAAPKEQGKKKIA